MLGSKLERRLSGLDRSKRGCCGIPVPSLPLTETTIGRGIKALNPGGVGAKPPQGCTGADNFLRKQSALS